MPTANKISAVSETALCKGSHYSRSTNSGILRDILRIKKIRPARNILHQKGFSGTKKGDKHRLPPRSFVKIVNLNIAEFLNHLCDHTILHGFIGRKPIVAIGIFFDLVNWLTGLVSEDFVQAML